MKIYNKKGFAIGIFWLAFGILGLVMYTWGGKLDIRNLFFCGCCIFLGTTHLTRSLSRNLSDEDQDERAKYVLARSRSSAFFWSKVLSLVMGLLYLLVYEFGKYELFLGMSLGFILLFAIMLILEGVIELYYEMRS